VFVIQEPSSVSAQHDGFLRNSPNATNVSSTNIATAFLRSTQRYPDILPEFKKIPRTPSAITLPFLPKMLPISHKFDQSVPKYD
jgi:hypothetical protein